MRPVLVLQHLSGDGPGHLERFLRMAQQPFDLRNSEAGEAFPEQVDGYRALAVLGGEMSANDDLPALRRAQALIRQAVAAGVPVLGHCLGGQLMARALGAAVMASPAPEVGWHPVTLADHRLARDWFGDGDTLTVFQWHSEAFALPQGAVALASSAACPHQAFAIGPHLAMQFHIELDEAKLARWSADRHPEYLAAQQRWPTVHSGERVRADALAALPAQRAAADRVYRRWLSAAG